jgi:1-phosphatidylinositol phosphodiesterase
MVQLYHGSVLLDQTAQLGDVFWGLYKWLDGHATETVIVSVKVDNGNSTASLEQTIHDLVTGQDVAEYWVQSTTLPTLGAARHKAVLLRRFAFDQLTDAAPIGIDASAGWSDNNPAFTISYSENNMAYIEDFYNVGGSDTAEAVDSKFAALSAHLDLATAGDTSQLYIGFASGYSGIAVNPYALAVGNGTAVPGMNTRAISYLAGKRGSRFGVILFDFIGSDTRIVPATLSQQVDVAATPSAAAGASSTPTIRRNSASSVAFSLPTKALVATFSISVASLLSVIFF